MPQTKRLKKIFALQAKTIKMRKTPEGFEVTQHGEAITFPTLTKKQASIRVKKLKEQILKGSALT